MFARLVVISCSGSSPAGPKLHSGEAQSDRWKCSKWATNTSSSAGFCRTHSNEVRLLALVAEWQGDRGRARAALGNHRQVLGRSFGVTHLHPRRRLRGSASGWRNGHNLLTSLTRTQTTASRVDRPGHDEHGYGRVVEVRVRD